MNKNHNFSLLTVGQLVQVTWTAEDDSAAERGTLVALDAEQQRATVADATDSDLWYDIQLCEDGVWRDDNDEAVVLETAA